MYAAPYTYLLRKQSHPVVGAYKRPIIAYQVTSDCGMPQANLPRRMKPSQGYIPRYRDSISIDSPHPTARERKIGDVSAMDIDGISEPAIAEHQGERHDDKR